MKDMASGSRLLIAGLVVAGLTALLVWTELWVLAGCMGPIAVMALLAGMVNTVRGV